VGVDPRGSDTVGNNEMLQGLSIGAPPDAFNSEGQNWNLTTFSPSGLSANGYGGFLAMLRTAMRRAGGIRLDHAMSLMRLWVVPEGFAATEGAYLHYPFESLLGLLCLESQRHRALVIAEDLGTVPPTFRQRIHRAGLLGMDVLWFARDAAGNFLPPRSWPAYNAALTSTHDLPTLAGWWRGRDLDWRERITGKNQAEAGKARAREKRALWKALRAGGARGTIPKTAAAFVDGVFTALARAPSPLRLVTAEDLTGEIEQPNIPGTVDEHPNWRRRLGVAQPFDLPAARRRAALLKPP
ncbi:MAG: 4-alpha-glucanotransferase, partial [Alphaproteobacteria bacterium]|nr:4-alpha-glucanotransferase [Alphaproteobacteria bacterium]